MFWKYAANLLENTQAEVRFQWSWSNFIEIALRHGCLPVNLLHIYRTPLLKNTSAWLLLYKFLSFYLKRSVSQTFKSSSCKKIFAKCVIIDTTCLDKYFLLHVITGNSIFLHNFFVSQRLGATPISLRSLKEVRILCPLSPQ